MAVIRLKRLHEDAKVPYRANSNDAGADLAMVGDDVTLAPGERALLPIGWAMEIPVGYYGRIAPRSGLSSKKGIVVLAGVVDVPFRGEVKVSLLNTGDEPVTFTSGDRIAQLVTEACDYSTFVEEKELTTTSRGEGGFGHTGR